MKKLLESVGDPGRGSHGRRASRGEPLLSLVFLTLLLFPPTALLGQALGNATYDPALEPLRREAGNGGEEFEAQRAPFPLSVRGDPVPYAVFFLVALPGSTLHLQGVESGDPPDLTYSAGSARREAGAGWSWTAPEEPGSYALRLTRRPGGAAIHLNVFVLRPAAEMTGDRLNGYRIGRYRNQPLRGDSIYIPPPGFIEISREDRDILVTPHLTVGQFLCKQEGEPRYLALSRYLVAKLERILEGVNEAGFPASTLHIMSGYRTPWYNQLIGNQTDYSRHLWGGAADIFVDVDGDGAMDDWDGDGRSTIEDARILMEISEAVDGEMNPWTRPGGLSAYRRNSVRGPFVHVDARGRPARW